MSWGKIFIPLEEYIPPKTMTRNVTKLFVIILVYNICDILRLS
jgi:hypothetical protein